VALGIRAKACFKPSSVGVLSVTDIIGAEERAERDLRDAAQSSLFSSELSLPLSLYEMELVSLRDRLVPASEQPVEAFMTREVVGVSDGETLPNILAKMVERHVHRVVVLNGGERVVGIITSMDVMSRMHAAITE